MMTSAQICLLALLVLTAVQCAKAGKPMPFNCPPDKIYESSANTCKDRCPDPKKYWDEKTKSCKVRCLISEKEQGGKCVPRCTGKTPIFDVKKKTCVAKICKCRATGDPHYFQYDGRRIDFYGKCKYTLTKTKGNNRDKCFFNIEEKNVVLSQYGDKVTWTGMVSVEVEDIHVAYNYEKLKLFVKGVDRTNSKFPIILKAKSGVSVEVNYKLYRFTVEAKECGMKTVYYAYELTTEIPSTLGSKVEGICGNCDGKQDDNDLKMKNGQKAKSGLEFAASWAVNDDSGIQKQSTCVTKPVPDKCTGKYVDLVRDNKHCGLITDAKGKFAQCIKSKQVKFKEHYSSCEKDVCINSKRKTAPKAVEKAVCKNLEAFADACSKIGAGAVWRTQTFCPKACEANAKYFPKMYTSCESTCQLPKPPKTCQDKKTPVEGCMCKPGFIRLGNSCLKPSKCGCDAPDGQHLKIGQTLLSKDCGIQFSCDKDANLKNAPNKNPCPSNGECKKVNGKYGCVCKQGYKRKGRNCEKIIQKVKFNMDIIVTLACNKATGEKGFKQAKEFIKGLVTKFILGKDSLRVFVVKSCHSKIYTDTFDNDKETGKYLVIIGDWAYSVVEHNVTTILQVVTEVTTNLDSDLKLKGKARTVILIGGFPITNAIKIRIKIHLYLMDLKFRFRCSIHYYAIGVTSDTKSWTTYFEKLIIVKTKIIDTTTVKSSEIITLIKTTKGTSQDRIKGINMQLVIILDGSTATGVDVYYRTLETIIVLIQRYDFAPQALELYVVFYDGAPYIYAFNTTQYVIENLNVFTEVFIGFKGVAPNSVLLLETTQKLVTTKLIKKKKPIVLWICGGMKISGPMMTNRVEVILKEIQITLKIFVYYFEHGTGQITIWKRWLVPKCVVGGRTSVTIIIKLVQTVWGFVKVTKIPPTTTVIQNAREKPCTCDFTLLKLGKEIYRDPKEKSNNDCCKLIQQQVCTYTALPMHNWVRNATKCS